MDPDNMEQKANIRMNELRIKALIKILAKEGVVTEDEVEAAVQEMVDLERESS